MRAVLVSAAATLMLAGTGISAQVQQKDVDIQSSDGLNLKGTYFSPGRPGPALLLLHQCSMDRHIWDGLAKDLADAGVHVLTFDYRGFGASGGERPADAGQRRTVMAETFPGDADAAYAHLMAQTGVDTSRVAAGGASCGVVQAGELATRHRDIKTLMLLSWYTSDAAKAYIASTPSIAVFGAAAEDDVTGPESPRVVANNSVAKHVRDLGTSSKNPESIVRIYPGAEHGVAMFAKNPELQPMIVAWFKKNLFPAGGTR